MDAESLRGAPKSPNNGGPKSPNNDESTFFNIVHFLPKYSRFEQNTGALNLFLAPGVI